MLEPESGATQLLRVPGRNRGRLLVTGKIRRFHHEIEIILEGPLHRPELRPSIRAYLRPQDQNGSLRLGGRRSEPAEAQEY